MTESDLILAGREAYRLRRWAESFAKFTSSELSETLGVDELEHVAISAQLIGEDDAAADYWERAHRECCLAGDDVRAARCAFWLAFSFLTKAKWRMEAAGSSDRDGFLTAIRTAPSRDFCSFRSHSGRSMRGTRGPPSNSFRRLRASVQLQRQGPDRSWTIGYRTSACQARRDHEWHGAA